MNPLDVEFQNDVPFTIFPEPRILWFRTVAERIRIPVNRIRQRRTLSTHGRRRTERRETTSCVNPSLQRILENRAVFHNDKQILFGV